MDVVVFDTVVYVRAMLDHRSVCARIVFEHNLEYTLVVSAPIVQEILDVLNRPALTSRFTTIPGRDIAAILNIVRNAQVVDIDESSFPRVCRDPKDDKFLATAVEAGAAYLVSEDNDLLVLESYGDVKIVDAAAFLATVR